MNKRGKKILIVDDDAIVPELLSKELKREGFVVLVAKDGREGLEKIMSEKPDLLLLDMIMPIMSGTELLEELKRQEILPGLSVIILTNLGNEIKSGKLLEYGIEKCIFKSSKSILEIVEEVKSILVEQS